MNASSPPASKTASTWASEDKTAWTHKTWCAHADRLLRIEAAEELGQEVFGGSRRIRPRWRLGARAAPWPAMPWCRIWVPPAMVIKPPSASCSALRSRTSSHGGGFLQLKVTLAVSAARVERRQGGRPSHQRQVNMASILTSLGFPRWMTSGDVANSSRRRHQRALPLDEILPVRCRRQVARRSTTSNNCRW